MEGGWGGGGAARVAGRRRGGERGGAAGLRRPRATPRHARHAGPRSRSGAWWRKRLPRSARRRGGRCLGRRAPIPPPPAPFFPSLVSVAERARLLAALDAASPTVSAGGSASNTVRAVARLGAAAAAAGGRAPLSVGWAPVAGGDAQGAFHAASMAEAGVTVVPGCLSAAAGATGTVAVLTTGDAQRSFLAHVEAAGPLTWTPAALSAAASTRILLIEGYLWELPGAEAAIQAAAEAARAAGGLVALTAGDAGVADRHRATINRALEAGLADVLFANKAEAVALLGGDPGDARAAAAALGSLVGVAAVTDGASGAAVSALGALAVVPPVWGRLPPVDTNGAGDAFAAGALHGLLSGLPIAALGREGARAAAAVIARRGAALTAAEAAVVVAAGRADAGAAAKGAARLPTQLQFEV